MLKRDQLGETFGTRKAKSRIKAAERNKVDAEAQAGVKDHLLSSIKLAGANIPSAGESQDTSSRIKVESLNRTLIFPLSRSSRIISYKLASNPSSQPRDHRP
jgi:hypothetical protein